MTNTARKRSPLADIAIILSLVILLAGSTLILSKLGKPGSTPVAAQPMPLAAERKIDPVWVKYRETTGIPVPEKQVRGVAVGLDGRVFVAAGFSVYEFLPDKRPGQTFAVDHAPRCIAVAQDGKLYLGAGDRIVVLDPQTQKTKSWDSLGQTAFLTSVAVAADSLFAGDAGHRKVWRYSLDGTLLGALENNTENGPESKANLPSTYFDVAADTDGTFWVTDAGRHGVLHYAADGTFLQRWGKHSDAISDFAGCCNPTHLSVAPDNRIVAVEKKPDLVKVHCRDGTFDSVVAGPKAFAPKTFIADVAAAPNGSILVVDPKMKLVRVFVPKAP